MKLYKVLSKVRNFNFKTAVTLGVFDGLHRGHQKVINKLIQVAARRKIKSVLITFTPHPLSLSKGNQGPPLINTIKQRLELIKRSGVDICILAEFTEKLASERAEDFLKKVLLDKLNMSVLVVSANYKFGKNAEGNSRFLQKMSRKYPFDLKQVAMAKLNGLIIRSTLIRNLLQKGKLIEANRMLSRPYFVEGEITKGKGLGAKIGFPTINLRSKQNLLLPSGVYIAWSVLNKKFYKSVVNLGFNPTIEKRKTRIIEAHILNLNKRFYGTKARLYFLKKLRVEEKFGTLEGLKKAIKADINRTKDYFVKHNILKVP